MVSMSKGCALNTTDKQRGRHLAQPWPQLRRLEAQKASDPSQITKVRGVSPNSSSYELAIDQYGIVDSQPPTVLDGSGFPRRSRVFAGNTSEPATLKDMLTGLGAPPGATVVMDAGIATEANLTWLRAQGCGRRPEFVFFQPV